MAHESNSYHTHTHTYTQTNYRQSSMRTEFKYGLKNASSYLQHIRTDKYADPVNEKTFDDGDIPNSRLTAIDPKSRLILMPPKQVELSDLITRENLKQTYSLYSGDLAKLEENKANLIQAIQELASRIQAIPDMQDKNQTLELENFKQKKELEAAIREYHDLKCQFYQKKSKHHDSFMRQKEKIKTLLDVCEEDHSYVVEVDSWKKYIYDLKAGNSMKEPALSDAEVANKILKKKEAGAEKDSNSNNERGQKQKKKQGKKMDNQGLLGDLKMFAKNFKMPPPNQV